VGGGGIFGVTEEDGLPSCTIMTNITISVRVMQIAELDTIIVHLYGLLFFSSS